MDDKVFIVDTDYPSGARVSKEFPTLKEAASYAGRMAQDSAIKRSEVRGMDADIKEIHITESSTFKQKWIPVPKLGMSKKELDRWVESKFPGWRIGGVKT